MDKIVLTTTGCYGTGSSAVTDLIREFNCVDCKGEYEVRFIHDPDGISDLEYNIIENPNRHNSSNSIKRFLKTMENLDHIWFIKRYRNKFGKSFLDLVYQYIDEITVCNYRGSWHYDVYDRGKLFYIVSRISANIHVMLNKYLRLPLIQGYDLIPKSEKAYLPTIHEDSFLEATHNFLDRFISSISDSNKRFVFLDQLVPPSNFERYIRYFKRIKIVLVERDPRDIYIMEKHVWKGRVAPVYDINKYCEWYKWTRKLYQNEPLPGCVLKIQFEDLVYYYNKTVDMIKEHFKLENQLQDNAFKFFNPDISISNTQTWKNFPIEDKNIKIIENELKEYCYLFPGGKRSDDTKHRMF